MIVRPGPGRLRHDSGSLFFYNSSSTMTTLPRSGNSTNAFHNSLDFFSPGIGET